MPKQTTKTPRSDKLVAAGDFNALLTSNNENMFAALKANEAAVRGMTDFSQEMMAFAERRLSENIQRSESLMHCKDVEEAFRLQYDFAQTATQHYLEEASKLVNLATRITRDCWAPLEDRTKETLHELNSG